MSGTSPIFRIAGPTQALSVVATLHAAVTFTTNVNDDVNFVALLNPGAVAVAVKLSTNGAAAVLPVDGTPGDFVLAPLMEVPVVLPLPTNGQITAIGAAAGPTLIYATPLVMQG